MRRGTPGYDAGFDVDDEILAIGDFRVRPDQWDARMDQYRPGERVSVLVVRRERLVRLDATFAAEPPRRWRLEANPSATDEQRGHLQAWLASTP